ncbi:MAG TPA: GTP-binding protein, partial [Polyangiaceae bacterium]|nr:GTP-binding protein [Polyangiaceae bacterium]
MSSKGRAERYELDKLRNIGVMAHIDAGKTTLTERILFYTGVSYKLGEVDEGTATMDWMEQEQERGITITAAATTCYWRSHQINLIDTPGHVDFTVEVERCLRVLDGAIAVFSAVEGVEPQSETVWRQADKYGVARVAFINKCDRSGADPEACVRQMSTKLGCRPLVLQLAVGLESEFRGVVDLIARRLLEWSEDDEGVRVCASDVPAALTDAVDAARAQLLEQLAEVDDPMLEAFANGVEPSEREIHDSIRRVTLARRGVPVLLGAAFRNKGVQPLLDAVVDYLPAPVDLPPCQATDLHGRPVTRAPDPAGPLAALAFKVVHDPHAGQLTYVRVYSGTLRTGESVL